MSIITFEIPGTPVAKQSGSWGNGHMYTKEHSRNYESLVIETAAREAPDVPIEGPVEMWIVAVFPRTKGLLFRFKKDGRYKHGKERLPYIQKPDFDNLKGVCDGITKAGIWVDDKQVYRAKVEMYYCAIGEQPHAEITIQWDE